MRVICDLHIHSHYSIATSRNLVPAELARWASIKGIQVIGTGDCTHPGWTAELKEELVPAEEGLYRPSSPGPGDAVRFMLTGEISTIYRKNGRVRKVHNLVLLPHFEAAEKLQRSLSKIGNITSDGRPILGFDSRDLLETVLSVDDEAALLPAHIWTPWFSVLGSKSGFDTIDECYGDVASEVFAIETGLSSDPAMNWLCGFLDRFTIISNSDAHSPEKLGREANILNCELSYPSVLETLRSGDPETFRGTIEFFPEEGKYHYDGHRKCGIVWDPVTTARHKGMCPACGKPVTMGVLNRVVQLADRFEPPGEDERIPFSSFIPLKEILSEILGVGAQSKKVAGVYDNLIAKCGSEFGVLMDLPIADLSRAGGEHLAEGVKRMRSRQVFIQEGYDGEFGRIGVFGPEELKSLRSQALLFQDIMAKSAPPPARDLISFDLSLLKSLLPQPVEPEIDKSPAGTEAAQDIIAELSPEQRNAMGCLQGPVLVDAGPGTGKTKTLTARINFLITERGIEPGRILAITFTNKAAEEIQSRLLPVLRNSGFSEGPMVTTFHALGAGILKENPELFGRTSYFTILSDDETARFIHALFPGQKVRADRMSEAKQGRSQDPDVLEMVRIYEEALRENNCFDFDDCICKPLALLEDTVFREKYGQRFRQILIDEVQDISNVQFELIRRLIASDGGNVFAIGDPDQSIYGFRGALPDVFEKITEIYPDAALFSLKESYRCPGSVLQASGQLLGNTPLLSRSREGLHAGVKVDIHRTASDRAEAEHIARLVEEMIGGTRFFSIDSDVVSGREENASPGDIGVLCRLGRQIDLIEKAFADHAIPSERITTSSLFGGELYPVRLLLTAAVNKNYRAAREYLTSKSGIHADDLERMFDKVTGELPVTDFIEAAAGLLGLEGKSPAAVSGDLETLCEMAEDFGSDYRGFLVRTALGSRVDLFGRKTDRVALMTIHAAKGLEFPTVIIPGCEEGIIPYSLMRGHDTSPAEEKRLLYVGMTRAISGLILTHAETRMLFGKRYTLERSSFLDEIEEDLFRLRRVRYEPREKSMEAADMQLTLFE